MAMKRFPEVCDFVSVTSKGVEYYGYIDDIDFDMRTGGVKVEFYPGYSFWFGFDDITIMEFPKKKNEQV